MHIFDFYGKSDFSNILPRNVFFNKKRTRDFPKTWWYPLLTLFLSICKLRPLRFIAVFSKPDEAYLHILAVLFYLEIFIDGLFRLHYVEKKSSGSVLEETKASLEASLKNSNEPMILWWTFPSKIIYLFASKHGAHFLWQRNLKIPQNIKVEIYCLQSITR